MFLLQLRRITLLPLVCVLAASAHAHTYVVGPGAGADFPDIPSAIAGSVAGDVLVLQHGSFAGDFTLDKGLTILGYGSTVTGTAHVIGIPRSERATIVQLSVAGFEVDGCAGPVILQDLSSEVPSTISASSDVRLLRADLEIPSTFASPAVVVSEARVELVDSTLRGPIGTWTLPSGGGSGLRGDDGSRVHVVRSHILGGNGYDTGGAWWLFAGDGSAGIHQTSSTAEVIVAGSGVGTVVAGDPGLNYSSDYCCQDGEGHEAVHNLGPIRYSGVAFHPSYTHPQSGSPGGEWCCQDDTCSVFGGGGNAAAAWPDDPTLSISGTPTNGGSVTLTITGPVGSRAWLELGRRTAVVPDPNSPIEELVVPTTTLDLGTIDSSGQASFSFGLPGFVGTHRLLHLPPGAFFAAQGFVTLSTGGMVRTNSIPIVGR